MHNRLAALLVALASISSTAHAQCPPEEVASLTAPGNQPWEGFGSTLSTSGEVTLVGCPWYGSPVAVAPGAAFVYGRDPLDAHAWTLTRTILAPAGHMQFGRTVALDGDIAAIACKDLSATALWVVHVHQRDAGGPDAWSRVATLHNDDFPLGSGDEFGLGLAVDGDTIAVGGPYHGYPWIGSVYLFGRDVGGPGNWGQIKRLDRPGGAAPSTLYTDFGRSLCLAGDALLVGDTRSGLAHLYERDLGGANQWGLVKSFYEPPPPLFYGSDVLSVAVRGDRFMVGRQFSSHTQTKWVVRIHERDAGGAGNWGVIQSLHPTGGSGFTTFGSSVAFDDQRALVGAEDDTGWPSRGGAVYVFEPLGSGATTWQQTARLTALDSKQADEFGHAVELEGTTAVVGNWRNGSGSFNLGKVHVFDLESSQPPVSYCTAGTSSNGCSGVLHGVGSPSASNVDGFELVAVGLDGQRSAAIFYGVSGPVAIPVVGTASWRCVHAPVQRLGIVDSGGTAGACDGSVRVDWNAFRASHPAALGSPFIAGQTIWAQAWSRDSLSPTGLSATQGLSFSLCP